MNDHDVEVRKKQFDEDTGRRQRVRGVERADETVLLHHPVHERNGQHRERLKDREDAKVRPVVAQFVQKRRGRRPFVRER